MAGWICDLTEKHMKDPVFLDAVGSSSSSSGEEGATTSLLPQGIAHVSMEYPIAKSRLQVPVLS